MKHSGSCKMAGAWHRKEAMKHMKFANEAHKNLQAEVRHDGQDYSAHMNSYKNHMSAAMDHAFAGHDHDGKTIGGKPEKKG